MNRCRHPFRVSALTALVLGLVSAGELRAQSAAPPAPSPDPPGEMNALRKEIQDLKDQVRALQEKVAALATAAPPTVATPPPEPAPPSVPLPAAAASAPARSQNLLNPAISAVFQAIGSSSLKRKDDLNGFDLSEAEVALQSVVDPYAKVDMFFSFPSDASPDVEEGYVTTLALPGSMQLKGGRFKEAFGKWNTLHTHAFPTVDRPDALVNFFGEESLTNDGMSLSVLIPNPKNLYIDSITEVGTAREGTAFNSQARSLTWVEHLSAFFTPSPSGNLELGLTAAFGRTGPSGALTQAIDACGSCGPLTPRSSLASRVQGLDVTYKWRPPRMNVYRSLLWQTEVLRSHRDLEVLTPALTLDSSSVSSLGGYTYLEWQWTKRWRAGARYDLSGFPDSRRARLWAASAVLKFQASEFQEIRFQIKHTQRNDEAASRFNGEADDNRVFFEWIPVIGAHGAHKF